MFGNSSRTPRTIAVMLVLAALVVPGTTSAATPPTIDSLVVFGNLRPGDPSTETDPALATLKTSETLFANSRPFGFRYEHGIAFVEGVASGDLADGRLRLFIDIEATDGTSSITRTVTVQPVDDPEIDKEQGFFSAQLDIWELGTHTATPGEQASNDPADWGGTVIDFNVRARATDGTLGPIATEQLTKYAGTPRDTFAPVISRLMFPPTQWCHLQAKSAQEPFDGNSFGATADGYCGDGAPVMPFDPTWVYCTEPAPGVSLRDLTSDPSDSGNGAESLWANQNFCPSRSRHAPGQYMPQGHARVSGHVDDLTAPNSFGVASDIASVTIQIFQGVVKLREVQSISRQGSQAGFGISLNINDFEPTDFGLIPLADPYVIKVVACDAWSNCSEAQSDDIHVYPY